MKRGLTYPVPSPVYTTNIRVKEIAEGIDGLTIIPEGNGYLLSFGSSIAQIAFRATLAEQHVSLEEGDIV